MKQKGPMQAPEVHQALNQLLSAINSLLIKASTVRSSKALAFLIVNDTRQVLPYDRATLWRWDSKSKPKLVHSSGQIKNMPQTELAKRMGQVISCIQEPWKPQELDDKAMNAEAKKAWCAIHQQQLPQACWLPIFAEEKPVLGLLIETWSKSGTPQLPPTILQAVNQFLLPAYGGLWEKLTEKGFKGQLSKRKKAAIAGAVTLLTIIAILPLPLRIVAPCEVVAQDPFVVAAPLQGQIQEIFLSSGALVDQATLLFSYRTREWQAERDILTREVLRLQAEWQAASQQGWQDEHALREASSLSFRIQKEKASLALAEYKLAHAKVYAPYPGVAIVEDPARWRGRLVQAGDEVLRVVDPKITRAKLWIPEGDQIFTQPGAQFKVVLNVEPSKTRQARLSYIAVSSEVREEGTVSFAADGEWVDGSDEGAVIGWKGTAVLYGPRTPLIYQALRKPWATLRRILGL